MDYRHYFGFAFLIPDSLRSLPRAGPAGAVGQHKTGAM